MKRLISVLAIAFMLFSSAPAFAGEELKQDRSTMVRLMNDARRERGIRRLVPGRRLTKYAQTHSRLMFRRYATVHTHPKLLVAFCVKVGYKICGENVGVYAGDVERLFEFMMLSKPHRKNILDSRFNRVGVGVYTTAKGVKWVTIIFAGVRR